MILKEAFRYQNYLDYIITSVIAMITNKSYIMNITQEHMRAAANPDAVNETVEVKKTIVFDNADITVNKVVEFLMDIYTEKDKLTAAISAAKSTAKLDMDSAIAMNKVRKRLAHSFKYMADTKAYERDTTGYGNMFNGEKNQVRYVYDIKEIGTIDYDRNVVKALAKKLNEQADRISADIDIANITIEVNYTPKYDLDDSLEDCLNKFVS